jgi:hypothetical protein
LSDPTTIEKLGLELCPSECGQPCDACLNRATGLVKTLAAEARMNNFVFTGKWLTSIVNPPTF